MTETPVAIVTGASRGIGRHIALALARDGYDIVCAARTTEESPAKLPGTIEATASEIEALGRRALAVQCDVRDEEQVEAMTARAVAQFGRVDVLINNAAVVAPAPFAELTAKRWDLMLDVNLRGTMLCSRAVLPRMREQGAGRIVNISSGAVTNPALSAQFGIIPYAVSKAAVEMLTVTLADELRPTIAVNCLRIESAIATEGARVADPGVDAEGWVEPEVAADAALWLVSRDITYTGNVVTMADARDT